MVSEVKVQSSNYAAEFGCRRPGQRHHQGRLVEFHGTAYDYIRNYHFQANDGSNKIAGVARPKSKFQYPGGNLSGPILIPGHRLQQEPRQGSSSSSASSIQRQKVDPGSSFAVTPTAGQRHGDFSDLPPRARTSTSRRA